MGVQMRFSCKSLKYPTKTLSFHQNVIEKQSPRTARIHGILLKYSIYFRRLFMGTFNIEEIKKKENVPVSTRLRRRTF